MKVIFLDFDGVLNSAASFSLTTRKKKDGRYTGKVNEHLCELATNNFQSLLKRFPEVQIVISSTWRELYELDWLKEKLAFYGIDSSRVIDKTPSHRRGFSGQGFRGHEIEAWLSQHPQVTGYVILDDNSDMTVYQKANHFVQTNWDVGFTVADIEKAAKCLHVKVEREENEQPSEE